MGSYVRHVRSEVPIEYQAELAIVDDIADKLDKHIDATEAEIAKIHIFGAQSKSVQDHFALLLKAELGFAEEVVLTPQFGLVTQSRPDFFYRLSEARGIIAEVERGGTTTNNHDLKDIWKAHIAPDAQHLFLIVPENNWKPDGSPREKPFPIVARRVGAFFGDARREIDLLSAHVFGY